MFSNFEYLYSGKTKGRICSLHPWCPVILRNCACALFGISWFTQAHVGIKSWPESMFLGPQVSQQDSWNGINQISCIRADDILSVDLSFLMVYEVDVTVCMMSIVNCLNLVIIFYATLVLLLTYKSLLLCLHPPLLPPPKPQQSKRETDMEV